MSLIISRSQSKSPGWQGGPTVRSGVGFGEGLGAAEGQKNVSELGTAVKGHCKSIIQYLGN